MVEADVEPQVIVQDLAVHPLAPLGGTESCAAGLHFRAGAVLVGGADINGPAARLSEKSGVDIGAQNGHHVPKVRNVVHVGQRAGYKDSLTHRSGLSREG